MYKGRYQMSDFSTTVNIKMINTKNYHELKSNPIDL